VVLGYENLGGGGSIRGRKNGGVREKRTRTCLSPGCEVGGRGLLRGIVARTYA